MDWIIYTLSCPRTNKVRYVGWTAKSAEARLRNHVHEAVETQKTHKQKWILSLVSIGLLPVVETVDSGSDDGWAEAERRWIAVFRANGARLVNGTDGGDGVTAWGTYEQRVAMGKRAWANTTPEERSALARKREAAKTPEERSASGRKRALRINAAQRSANIKSGWDRMSSDQRSARVAKMRASQMSKPAAERSEKARRAMKSRITVVAGGFGE